MHVIKTVRRKRELQVGFAQDTGHVSLICFRTVISPYDAFVQTRKYIFSGQTNPTWSGEQSLGRILAHIHHL